MHKLMGKFNIYFETSYLTLGLAIAMFGFVAVEWGDHVSASSRSASDSEMEEDEDEAGNAAQSLSNGDPMD